uniref:Threonine synthase-like 2 n=1 Tax=Felis catus TaxID=9685 RepID=A0ABI7W0F8_FELCA
MPSELLPHCCALWRPPPPLPAPLSSALGLTPPRPFSLARRSLRPAAKSSAHGRAPAPPPASRRRRRRPRPGPGLIDQAFSRFRHREVVHLSRLRNGLNVLELWHGVTYAFKDLSLCCTAQFLQYFLEKKEKHVTVVVGTSGDTGSAAIESVQGAKNMDIIVLLPKGHCTKIQELQMTTVLRENVHVFGVEGNSDELDEPIKAVFADVAFVKKHNLMSLNSINWSRVLVQMAHHFFAYFQCAPSLDMDPLPRVEVVVPTGAAGNLAAGCLAQKMGLPVRLVVAVNRNDIIHRTVQQGDFSLSEAVEQTLASAMDIQVPYNMERIFWLLSGSNSQVTRALMEQFERTHSVSLPKELHSKLSGAVTSESVSDEAITQTMARCWEENKYLLCPHSAVAVSYHYQQTEQQPPRYRPWAPGSLGYSGFQGPFFPPSRGDGSPNKWLY